ncbi:MAG TPA: HDOD domain-containing protein [Planctomycetaceae bacterium]|nr:HDOD domain-containing protein [Planctomycetaceae bacterium]
MASSNEVSGSIFRKPQPKKILRSELNQLIEMLHASDSSLIKFGEQVSQHPAVLKQILRAANSSLTGSAVEITRPAHAALFLGSRRVIFLLNTLPPEIIEEDLEEVEESR